MKIKEGILNIFKGFSRENKDPVYNLCKRYISVYDGGDGYWITDTEIQLYTELKKRLKKLDIIKEV